MADIESWWSEVSDELRNHLREAGDDALTAAQVAEIVAAGGAVASDAYWLESQSGPQGFYLTRSEVQYAADH